MTVALTLCLACGNGHAADDAAVDANALFMVGSCGSAWGSAAQAQDSSSSLGCQVAAPIPRPTI
jgi:hypothetical protein